MKQFFIYIFILLSIFLLSLTLFILYSKNKKKCSNEQEENFIKSYEIFIYRCVDVVYYKVRGSLYAWVYETSVGNVVSNYTRQGLNPYIQIKMAIETYGPAIFLSITHIIFIIFYFKKI